MSGQRKIHRSKKDKINVLENNSKPKEYLVILVSKDEILIQDYSHRDVRHKLIQHLEKAGIKTKIVFDSWCG